MTTQIPSYAFVLFSDGKSGAKMLYVNDKGQHYVYREYVDPTKGRGTRFGRAYVKRGESVDWVECSQEESVPRGWDSV